MPVIGCRIRGNAVPLASGRYGFVMHVTIDGVTESYQSNETFSTREEATEALKASAQVALEGLKELTEVLEMEDLGKVKVIQ